MTSEELQEIKKEIMYWANNCGGCETCSNIFGNAKEPTYDMRTVWEIISFLETEISLNNSKRST